MEAQPPTARFWFLSDGSGVSESANGTAENQYERHGGGVRETMVAGLDQIAVVPLSLEMGSP